MPRGRSEVQVECSNTLLGSTQSIMVQYRAHAVETWQRRVTDHILMLIPQQ